MSGLLLLVLVLALLTARLFVWPATDEPGPADAVVVLSGDHGDRLRLARRLLDQGLSETLVLIGLLDSPEAHALCAQSEPGFETVCLVPQPDSTRQEARALATLMRERGWDDVIVATTSHHVTRTRLLFNRCTEGNLRFVGSKAAYDDSTAVQVITHEIRGFLYAMTVARGC